MKQLIYIATIALVILGLAPEAGAGCPIRQDNLEDFARCMVPMKGTIGMATVYSSGRYDRDNRQLMSAMMRSQIVPRHTLPATVMQTYPYSNYYRSPAAYMNLYFAGHSSYRNNWYRFASFYYPYYRYNPNMWIYAYYRH